MISYKHKCIFIHIPKTGGSSIEHIIWPSKKDRVEKNLKKGYIEGSFPNSNKYQTGGLQHLLAKQVRQEIEQDNFNQFYKFSIVRNPWDKIISQFTYMQVRTDLQKYLGIRDVNNLKEYLSLIQSRVHVQWKKQYSFILDDNGEQLVDFLGRFENFETDVMSILRKLRLDKKLFGFVQTKTPHQKKSKRKPYQGYFDAESREMVQFMYQEDIDLFNYMF